MKTALEIKEQYASICEETCEGYQHEHILEAMESYASEREAKWRELYEAMKERLNLINKELVIITGSEYTQRHPPYWSETIKIKEHISEIEKELNLNTEK